MRRLRVLHVVHDYFPAIGGSETLFQKIGEGLAARGAEVWVFTSTALRVSDFVEGDGTGLPPGLGELNGVHVRRFRYVRFPRWVRRGLGGAAAVWWSRHWPGYGRVKAAWVGPHLPGLVRAAVRLHPDLITATAAPFLPMYAAARAGRRAGVPVALMPCLHPGDRWLTDNPALFALLRRADAVLTLTRFERLLLQSLGVEGERLHHLGGGVSPEAPVCASRDLREQFHLPRSEPLVLFFGRKEEGKGLHEIVEAMRQIWQDGSRATLVLAGASTTFSATHLLSSLEGLPSEWRSRIIVRDDVSEAEKWGWYTECDLLVHPSRIESFGLVYLEAWLCGKPVIGGRTGPQASLIADGRDGLLAEPGHVGELVVALRRLLSEPGLARALGEAGRAKVLQDFTWARVIDRAETLYHTLVGGDHGALSRERDRRHAR
ncbi:MAG: glycosyltransferase family 4 protein [Candidatus Rokuibacteriota bacterium]